MSEPALEPRNKTQAILDAAVRLFTQFGYRRTSMEDIARAAQVAKGTLYLYFDGKEAVFRAMQRRNLNEVDAEARAAAQSAGGLEERLYLILDALYGALHRRYGHSEHLTELASTRLAVGADIARDVQAIYAARLGEVLGDALATGEARLPPGLETAQLTALLQAGAAGAKTVDGAPVTAEAYAESLRGLARLTAAALRPA